MNKKDLLRYEVAGAGWYIGLLGCFFPKVLGTYFAKKVNRKYARYKQYLKIQESLNEEQN